MIQRKFIFARAGWRAIQGSASEKSDIVEFVFHFSECFSHSGCKKTDLIHHGFPCIREIIDDSNAVCQAFRAGGLEFFVPADEALATGLQCLEFPLQFAASFDQAFRQTGKITKIVFFQGT